jgi:hypothetical protein
MKREHKLHLTRFLGYAHFKSIFPQVSRGFPCHVAGSRKNVSGILLKQMLASCILRGGPMSREDYHTMSQGLDEAGHDLGRMAVDSGLAFPAWSQ